MKRPVVLIVSVAAGAFLVAGAGASAHTIQLLTRSAGTQSSLSSDEASGARTESPEPSESPEATETPEAAATPEPAETPGPAQTPEAAGNDNEAADTDTATGDNQGATGPRQRAKARGVSEI